jgi:amino acid adenylation domain-containing protein
MNAHPATARPGVRAPDDRLDLLFAAQAARSPLAVAVLHQGRALTYRALDERANRLAHYLRRMGVRPGVRAAIALKRTPDLIVGLIAVLKAGGAYVPLDPAQPQERLEVILRDSGAALLVSNYPSAHLRFDGQVCNIDMDREGIESCARDPLAQQGTGQDPAYILYGAGATDVPAGVVLRHSATAMVRWAAAYYPPQDLARVAATSPICVDPAVFEIFVPLCTGGTIVLKHDALDPFLPGENPTLVQGMPATLRALAQRRAIPESVRAINIGGATVPGELARLIYGACRVERLYHHYGPTEATTVATVALVARDAAGDPPAGRPVDGTSIRVLDREGRPVPPGETGEIHIAGSNLALGYAGKPALTRHHFLPDPAGPPGATLYRTGDLGHLTPTGDLVLEGRLERQVLLRGRRIALGEVEAGLMRLPGMRQAAALVAPGRAGRPRLVGYVVGEGCLSPKEMRAALKALLPRPLLPALLVPLAALPRTASGTIDYALLPPAPVTETRGQGQDETSRVEAIVAAAFARELGLATVGPLDDFHALGGDTLQALGVALDLESVLHRPVSARLLVQAGTPRALARILGMAPPVAGGHVTLLATGGDGHPLFCLPDLYGEPADVVALAGHLAADRTVYGLMPGPLAAAMIAAPSVELLTTGYLAAIRKVQPRGPYHLAGCASGGIAAFDLACALEASGERVTLVLVDAPVRRAAPPLRALFRWVLAHGPALVRKRGVLGAVRSVLAARRPASDDEALALAWGPPPEGDLARALVAAARHYRFGSFGGDAILVGGTGQSALDALLDHDGMQGWEGALKGDVEIIVVPVHRGQLLREPPVAEVAARLRPGLDRSSHPRPPERHKAAAQRELEVTVVAVSRDHGMVAVDQVSRSVRFGAMPSRVASSADSEIAVKQRSSASRRRPVRG